MDVYENMCMYMYLHVPEMGDLGSNIRDRFQYGMSQEGFLVESDGFTD